MALALALADRLDSLAALFAAGLGPKGSNDPFGLRRMALHIIENLTTNEVSLDLRDGLNAAGALLPVEWNEQVLADVVGFIGGRLEGVLREAGYSSSVVKAVLAEQTHDPYQARLAAEALTRSDRRARLGAAAQRLRPLCADHPLAGRTVHATTERSGAAGGAGIAGGV